MITCYEGRQGSGKTACAVLDAVKECIRMGKKKGKVWNLYTNMESFNIRAIKERFKANLPIKVNYIDSFEDLFFVVDGVVLLMRGIYGFLIGNGQASRLSFFFSGRRRVSVDFMLSILFKTSIEWILSFVNLLMK